MARPIRNLTTMKGFDVTKHFLATFGGAGPQFACAIAKSLGIHIHINTNTFIYTYVYVYVYLSIPWHSLPTYTHPYQDIYIYLYIYIYKHTYTHHCKSLGIQFLLVKGSKPYNPFFSFPIGFYKIEILPSRTLLGVAQHF
jgi:hypothetical protein